jgi:Tol biopolymer transport system component/predicted Ser/Thr protein kinase
MIPASPVLLSTGTRLGPYEIIAPIGAGGMGEVYKALDTRLNRIVAIKKGLAPFSERFDREAHAIASLNHPHICSLYDVGPDYLVMEYIEGKPLAGPVDLDEALVLAQQILDAIDAAHRKGIVHRDLKPANILVTKSGVKLLDFGLAKASAELAANMATVGGPATGLGTILGTLQYMSPEQLEAKDADARSDIFAFGAVLYELITGKRAFEGSTPASVIASILKEQPQPITQLSPMTPTGIDRVVQTCLEKDPDRRWQSAHEVKHALDWVSRDALATPVHPERKTAGTRSLRLWQGATAAALAAVGVMVWVNRPPPAPAAVPVRFQIAPPAGVMFETYVALSPDGQRLAFTATGADGIVRLWYRDLKSVEPQILRGTEGAQSAFWSPDSRYIAFGFRNQLKKIDPSGGPPQTLCEVEGPVGSGAWTQEGVILFGRRGVGGLTRVSEAGGAVVAVTEGGFSGFPSFLPDGRRFLYFRRGTTTGVFAGSLDNKPEDQPTTPVLVTDVAARYVSTLNSGTGYMFFVRDQTLMAQRFDERTLGLAGEAVVIDRVATVNNYPVFSASTTGRLAYRTGNPSTSRQLTWFTREGKALSTVGDPGGHEQLALSPDGTRAIYRDVVSTLAGDLWVTDLTRGTNDRFTSERTVGGFPVWSPDAGRIAFRSGQDVFLKPSSGEGEAERLFKAETQASPTSWSPDGKFLLLTVIGLNSLFDIQVLTADGNHLVSSFLKTQYNESQATFSPDGQWVAYTSTESGRNEVYVRPFTPPGIERRIEGKWPVSREGGTGPVWREDGRELIFRSASGAPMAVDITLTATTVQAGIPKQLFPTPPVPWSVTADGKRFLVSMPPRQDVQVPITIDLNWEAALKR